MMIIVLTTIAAFIITIVAGIVLDYAALKTDKRVGFRTGFLLAAALAALISGGLTRIFNEGAVQHIAPQRGILTFAASLAGLPHLAEIYSTGVGELYFYDQADLAYSLASGQTDKTEILKYRTFLTKAMEIDPGIHHPSKANIFYALAKISLLLDEKQTAIDNFKQAYVEDKATVDEKLVVDASVRDFLTANHVR